MKYNDIINLKFKFKNHARMSIESRSAQFAPFSALTGYNESIKEVGRITNNEIEISDDIKNIIDMKLQIIENNIKDNPYITVLYFKKDKTKEGGEYIEYIGNIKKIDLFNKLLIFNDNKKINLNNIYDIKSDILNI